MSITGFHTMWIFLILSFQCLVSNGLFWRWQAANTIFSKGKNIFWTLKIIDGYKSSLNTSSILAFKIVLWFLNNISFRLFHLNWLWSGFQRIFDPIKSFDFQLIIKTKKGISCIVYDLSMQHNHCLPAESSATNDKITISLILSLVLEKYL